MNRYAQKACAVVDAWKNRYGTMPSKHAVTLVCAVAEHETRCGDAWNHAHNWGAIQRRTMTPAERAIVQTGGTPPPVDAFEELHGDSSPIHGRYQVWFWKFPDDVQGANQLLGVLLENRDTIKAHIDTLSTDELARLMYLTHYFEGFHDPRPKPGEVVTPGALTQGQLANIADYAGAIGRTASAFEAGLAGWTPGQPPIPEDPNAPDLASIEGCQAALARLGYEPGPIDGVNGPRTQAATMKFQREHQPDAGTVDGTVGPRTRATLEVALAKLTNTS